MSDLKMLNGPVKKLGSGQQEVDKGPRLSSSESYMHKDKKSIIIIIIIM